LPLPLPVPLPQPQLRGGARRVSSA